MPGTSVLLLLEYAPGVHDPATAYRYSAFEYPTGILLCTRCTRCTLVVYVWYHGRTPRSWRSSWRPEEVVAQPGHSGSPPMHRSTAPPVHSTRAGDSRVKSQEPKTSTRQPVPWLLLLNRENRNPGCSAVLVMEADHASWNWKPEFRHSRHGACACGAEVPPATVHSTVQYCTGREQVPGCNNMQGCNGQCYYSTVHSTVML
eukprot:COSAG02_NODE_209_length_28965_cov_18.680143_31_plen_202_part_00